MSKVDMLRRAAPVLGLVVLPVASLVAAFFLFQTQFEIATFDATTVKFRMDEWISPVHRARGEAARTHWLASLYLASALLVTVAGWSLAIIRRRWWSWLLASALIGLAAGYIPRLVPPLQTSELRLITGNCNPPELAFLKAFLGFTVATIGLVAIAVGYTLERVRDTESAFRRALAARDQGAVADASFNDQYRLRIDALHTARDALRALLALTTAWLVSGIVGIGLLHRWPWAGLPEGISEILRPLGSASTIFTGAFYSSLLCAVFLPTELYVRHAAYEMGAIKSGLKVGRSELRKWLTEEGFDASTIAAVTRLSTVFAPLIAGVLQGVAAL